MSDIVIASCLGKGSPCSYDVSRDIDAKSHDLMLLGNKAGRKQDQDGEQGGEVRVYS